MNITIDREILLENLNVISRGLPAKTPMPILTGIKLEATDTDIYMTSSNTDISVEVLISDSSLEIKEAGKTVIPGRFFIDIIRKINSKKVNLYIQDDKILVIRADRGEYKLHIMDIMDYPNIDFVCLENPLELDASVLKGLIRETVFATATSEKKPILTGVNFKHTAGSLVATATDSFLLSPRDKERDKEITYSIIKLSIKKDRIIEISTTNQTIGDAKEEIIPTDIETSSPITIGFSSRYLIEALRSFISSEISLNLCGEIRPFIIHGDNDPNLTQLILPVKMD